MKYKKIWKEEDRFVISSDMFLYEVMIHQSGLPYRKLYPVFENRFWEVYVLHRENGLYYAVVGKHHDVRIFYKNALVFSRTGNFYLPIGRDLAVRTMGDVYWNIYSAKGGEFVNVTTDFFAYASCGMAYISSVRYLSPIVALVFKSRPSYHGESKAYLKQGENGYKKVEESEIEQYILNAKALPEDPWYVL